MKKEALAVIDSTRVGTLATLREDGSPYVTPITYTFVDGLFVWLSAPDAEHSLNIARDPRVSLSIVENTEQRAVYINTTAEATGQTTFNEAWQQELEKYQLALGKLDIKKSTEGRFYFKGAAS